MDLNAATARQAGTVGVPERHTGNPKYLILERYPQVRRSGADVPKRITFGARRCRGGKPETELPASCSRPAVAQAS